MLKNFSVLLAAIILFSCNGNEQKALPTKSSDFKRVYVDNFTDTIEPFWRINQITHPDRLKIVEDPTDPSNDVLKISLETGDSIAKGYRNEIVIHSKDSFGYINKYSYRFMFPKEFFKKEPKSGIIVLNQWHDEPYPGFSWKNKAIKVKPPFAMYISHDTTATNYKMVMHSGVKMGAVNEMTVAEWPNVLQPEQWYEFNCEIFWSLYEDGYVKASINNVCFEIEDQSQCVFPATNMYHKRPNYYKMGLYWSAGHTHNRYIYYDDFKMETKRIGYFPPRKDSLK